MSTRNGIGSSGMAARQDEVRDPNVEIAPQLCRCLRWVAEDPAPAIRGDCSTLLRIDTLRDGFRLFGRRRDGDRRMN